MLNKITGMMMMVLATLFLTGCVDDDKPYVLGDSLHFEAVNLSVDADGKNKATSLSSSSIGIDITIGDGMNAAVMYKKDNQLLVSPGNEIEITFLPSCAEEKEAVISLPDGNTRRLTVTEPTFKWVVPDKITPEMGIDGRSQFDKDDTDYTETGYIYLVPIK